MRIKSKTTKNHPDAAATEPGISPDAAEHVDAAIEAPEPTADDGAEPESATAHGIEGEPSGEPEPAVTAPEPDDDPDDDEGARAPKKFTIDVPGESRVYLDGMHITVRAHGPKGPPVVLSLEQYFPPRKPRVFVTGPNGEGVYDMVLFALAKAEGPMTSPEITSKIGVPGCTNRIVYGMLILLAADSFVKKVGKTWTLTPKGRESIAGEA